MKKIFKSITAIALVAAMGCTTAFAASPKRLEDSDFVRSYDSELNWRLTQNRTANTISGDLYKWETSKKVTVFVPGGNDMTNARLYGESSLKIQADKGWDVVLQASNKPNPTLGGAYAEYQSVSAYPMYMVTPYVFHIDTWSGNWYKTKCTYAADKKTGFLELPVPSGSCKYSWKPYVLVFSMAPDEFEATITKTY